ncbi:hypothetical protein CVT25_011983 [Psilocybe cyanescens]|uniref:Uncharacterized protein n=1 Tax=Psilocybe cyanescens TaxID=93625 RepID=A0A409VWJ1_PSICY|nr:hypothetical protein CVT25_011983 [Psilocybe cyanescens]
MPAEFPGLYWDETRNRYFPLSSRPKPPPPAASTIASNLRKDTAKLEVTSRSQLETAKRRKHQNVPWYTNVRMLSGNSYTRALRDAHEILCFQYASTSRVTLERLPTLGPIQAFCSTRVGDTTWHLAGDDQGWLYTRQAPGGAGSVNDMHRWIADPIMRSSDPISSISASGSHCIVSCMGPGKVSVQNMIDPELLFLLKFNSVHDIRTSHLQGPSLVLGASKKAAYLSDIDISRVPEHLVTNSDVFSIARQTSLVYTGSRSGTVHRFDMRTPKHKNQTLFDNRFGISPRSSVVHLDIIRDRELLMSHLNGDLLTYDLRFASESAHISPTRIFEGHINSYTHNLGITIDHERDLLYAAGQDRRIRAWSLRTGAPLIPQPSERCTTKHANPLATTFSDSIYSLRIANELSKEGVSLWAASGRELYEFHLGQRGLGSKNWR